MLVRAYRLTDKLGVALIKTGAGISEFLLERTTRLSDGIQRSGRALFGSLWTLIALLFAGVLFVLQKLWQLTRWLFDRIRRILIVVLGTIGGVVSRVGRIGSRATGRAIWSTTRGPQAIAASRTPAAHASTQQPLPPDVSVAEDPLKTQNRVLSGLVVVVLGVLILVVVWATSSGNNSEEPLAPGVIDLNPGGQDVAPTENPGADEILFIPTPIPTATDIPAVLQAGGTLAYTQRERGQTDIWAVPVGSRNAIRLTNSPFDERDPEWSPDGQRLAYASREADDNWNLFLYDLVTGGKTQLSFDLGFQAGPTWSPDGAFLAYEAYQESTHLDIFVVPIDGSSPPQRLPGSTETADFSPAWSPDLGRQIAFTSWRDGSKDIFIYDLDSGTTRNITNTPNRNEDHAAWSPDGNFLAYSSVENGLETVMVKSAENLDAPGEVVRQGSEPTWSPDSTSFAFAVDAGMDTFLTVAPYIEGGVTTEIYQVAAQTADLTWSSAPLPPALVNTGGLPLGVEDDLFIEQVPPADGDPPYSLGDITGVEGPEQAFLSVRVNDSFNALRRAANDAIGIDFLGTLTDAFWEIDRRVPPGQSPRSWHKAGRAVAFTSNQGGFPQDYELVQESDGLNTYWRVFVRVADEAQNGLLGEPLRNIPWDFAAAGSGDIEAYNQGGRLRATMPRGYYVDLTQLAADYGWERGASGSDWRTNFNTRNYWRLQNTDGLSWYAAMREIYAESQLGGFVPTPTPAPLSTLPAENEETNDGT
jgi:TolB protein